MGNIATRNDQNNKLQTTREARAAKAKTKTKSKTKTKPTSSIAQHSTNVTTFVDSFDEEYPNKSNNNSNINTNNDDIIVTNSFIDDDGNNTKTTLSTTTNTTATTNTNTTSTTTTKSTTTITSVQHKLKVQRNSDQSAAGGNTTNTTTPTINRLKQISSWSLGSLNLSRLNWSFTGANRKNSFRNRNKSVRKSLTTLQQEQRRSKTTWHRPLTNAIFATHFKESNRNDQYHIEHLIAKGAFGVVFKVIDKQSSCQANSSTSVSNKFNISYKNDAATINQDNNKSREVQKAQQQYYSAHSKIHQHQHQQQQQQQQQSQHFVYALKVLKKAKIIEENSVQQIKDEADIQKLCGHHPFIVQQIDSWQNRRNLHILSEYMPNGELFQKITTFSIDLIRLYIAEIALALDFLHHAGVIYRDAKPENILLTHDFHIKLTDFGLSKWLKLGATTRTMCGTFQFMGTK